MPFAARKVYAVAPPTRSASTRAISCSITLILSLTLAPPSSARYGFFAPERSGRRCLSSAITRYPAPRCGTCLTMPTVDACARWTVPNASSTYTSASCASFCANCSSFFSSSAWKRRFSSRTTCPSFISETSLRTPSPTQSSAKSTSSSKSCESRSPTFSSDISGTTLPSGRPRCEARMVFAFFPTRWRMVGSAARMRASSFTAPVFLSSGTLKSTRTKTRFPATSSASIERTMPLQLRLDEERHVHHAVREAPLVVVPGEDLGEPAALGHRGLGGVVDRGVRVAVVVDRDGQLVVVLEDALHPPLGSRPHRLVDVVDARRLPELDGEIDDRDV